MRLERRAGRDCPSGNSTKVVPEANAKGTAELPLQRYPLFYYTQHKTDQMVGFMFEIIPPELGLQLPLRQELPLLSFPSRFPRRH